MKTAGMDGCRGFCFTAVVLPAVLIVSTCFPGPFMSRYFTIIRIFIRRRSIICGQQSRSALSGNFLSDTRFPLWRGRYDTDRFYRMAEGMEQEPEGGKRCFACYELRLREAAEYAKDNGYDFFTTTLSISPLKNAAKLNEIGGRLAEEYGIPYLFSDFKKKEGYKRSAEISCQYDMYRQYYCGCIYSKRDRDAQIRKKEADEAAGNVSAGVFDTHII